MPTRTTTILTLAALALLLAGCATPPRSVDPSGTVRRSVPELMALRPADLTAALTSRAGERLVYETEVAALRATLAAPGGTDADGKLPGALSAALFFNVEKELARAALLTVFPGVHEKSPAYQRDVLSAAHAMYWHDAAPLLPALLPKIKTAREFAIAAYTLLRHEDSAQNRQLIAQQMYSGFPDWAREPRLRALHRRLNVNPADDLSQRPALTDLLAAPIRSGYPVLFSFQRRDREHTGLAMVRGGDGRFVRNGDGTYFNIAQLAMARSNLPGTITNGNTPQGVFVIRGTGTATNRWIGPTPYLESMLPIEGSVSAFEHAETPGEWSEEKYESFLPAAWRRYFPIREAFLAGQAGRDEILAHGNTVNPAYYRDEPFFPAAPSAGCLVAMEYWSGDDGTLVHSDQLALVKAFVSGGKDAGYLVVVELDDKARPVVLADVVESVMAAERLAR